jgi:hypothetical protein
MNKFPPATTPDYCPFSVEVEPSSSHSFEHLRLSTVNKSWSLAMRTTNSGSNLIDTGDSEDKDDADDEFPLNQIDADIGRALSNEKVPFGLVPISSDSESSSRDESIDIDSEDEEEAMIFAVPPSTPRAGSSRRNERHLPCDLSPRLSTAAPTNGELQRNPQQQAPPNPLNPLKVLNPGVPQGHGSHRHHKRHNSMSRTAGTPQREGNALVAANSNAVNSLAADCMCFAIEDVTQFFCPATPKSTTIDNTSPCPPGIDCFPAYDYGATSSSNALGASFPSIQDFWASPKNSPLPRSREEQLEALFLMNANLPRNRSHFQRRKHVRKLLTIWHGAEGSKLDRFGSRDDFHLVDKPKRRRKRNSLTQPKCCYDSDPEQEVQGKYQRRSSLLSRNRIARSFKPEAYEDEPQLLEENDSREKQHQPHFRKFRPEPFTHLDTDEESSSDDDESSYETAKCSPAPSPPAAPRNSDNTMSFDFGETLTSVDVDGETNVSEPKTEEQATFEFGKADTSRSTDKGHRRERSTTSLSTTGHSRFHTIRMSPEQVQEGSDSSQASSDGFSSISGSTALNAGQKGASKKEQQQHPLPSYFQSFPNHWTEFQLLFSRNVDEESVKSHVHELSNVRFPLVWHPGAQSPPQGSTGSTKAKGDDKATAATASSIHCSTSVKIASLSSNASEETSPDTKHGSRKGTPFPISVHGAFEVGAHLEHMVVQPKFTWTPNTQPHRITGDPEANHHELFLSGSAPPQVELLSIIRVNKAVAKQLDRNLYPYARVDRTCIVSTNDANHPTIVLEARSTQERDWLIFSLKIIVARLASIIITRDEDMLHEFFSPYSALMRLEEEEVPPPRPEHSDKATPQQGKDQNGPTIECAVTPTNSCDKAVVVIDGEGFNDFVFPKDTEDEEIEDDESSTGSGLLVHDDVVPDDDLADMVTEDEDDDALDEVNDGAYQVRDDMEIEDSIRARNSGAYAILKRSLTATGPLVDYEAPCNKEGPMPRTFSY